MKKLTLLGVCAALLPPIALAGAWTPGQGASYHKFAFNYFAAQEFFDSTTPGFEEFVDLGVSYYGEYGLRDNLGLFGSVPFKFLTRTDSGSSIRNNGIGDIDLGLRYRLFEKPFVLSTAVLLKLPYAYRDNDPLALGNGQEDIEWRWLAGKTLGLLGYVGAEVAYRWRLGAPADEFRYLLEFGYNFSESYYFRSKFDGLQGIGSSDSGAATSGNPALSLEFDVGRLDLTAGYRSDRKWAWEFTYGLPIYGRNTLRGETLQLALIYTP